MFRNTPFNILSTRFNPWSLYRPNHLSWNLDVAIVDGYPAAGGQVNQAIGASQRTVLLPAPLPAGVLNRRRLLQFPTTTQPTPRPTFKGPSLAGYIPGLANSVVGQFGVQVDAAEEVQACWTPSNLRRTLPTLYLNGTIDLSASPFNLLQLSGVLHFDVYVWPFQSPRFGVPLAAPGQTNVLLQVDYPTNLDFGGGVRLTDVNLQVQTAFNSPAQQTVFTVGGSLALAIPGQSAPLTLDAKVVLIDGSSQVNLAATLGYWQHPFGLDWLTLQMLQVTTIVGQGTPDLDLRAHWVVSDATRFKLEGRVSGTFVGLGLEAGNLTFAQIGEVYNSVVGRSGNSLGAWSEQIVFQDAFIGQGAARPNCNAYARGLYVHMHAPHEGFGLHNTDAAVCVPCCCCCCCGLRRGQQSRLPAEPLRGSWSDTERRGGYLRLRGRGGRLGLRS